MTTPDPDAPRPSAPPTTPGDAVRVATADSALVRAARQRDVPHTPVWFMRQAGRSLPEYRKVREGVGMLESCRRPDLVTEITLQPVRRHGVDAAIFFSDIVVPLSAIGVDLDIVAGRRPGRRPRRSAPGPTSPSCATSPPTTSPTSPSRCACSPPSSGRPRSSASPVRPSPWRPTSSRAARRRTTSTPRR